MIISKPKIKAGKRQKVVYFGYSKATAGGGATIKSTSSGGGTTRSTSSGGGSSQTSSSGGGSSQTSSSGGGTSTSTQSGGGGAQTSGVATGWDTNNYNFVSSGPFTAIFNESNYREHQHTISFSSNDLEHHHNVNIPAHSHSFSVPNHTHTVNIPSHTHTVNIPSHTHDVTIPNHTHDIELPNHTHDVQHEIVELSNLPTSVTIKVDGNVVPHTSTSGNRINLVDYMAKDSSGRITRGRHEVEILPNGLARIEADLICRVFIQSQLGGTY